eukprot:m.301274 g.301274  ORF g.301274 m.301274 type:complete len:55 (+) comp20137_c1_seq4:2223-2387(+)
MTVVSTVSVDARATNGMEDGKPAQHVMVAVRGIVLSTLYSTLQIHDNPVVEWCR